MKSKYEWKLGCAVAGLYVAFSAAAWAQSTVPAGPWITPDQNVALEGFESYEQLTDKLMGIEARSGGLVEIESVAVTNEGRDVWLVKIGDPSKTPVLVITAYPRVESAIEAFRTDTRPG